MIDEWIVQAKGSRDSDWEISLVRKDNKHGQLSWGWCDDDISDYSKCEKILVGKYFSCHCAGTMVPEAFDCALDLAHKLLKSQLS
jgi:hypothetical protein